MAYSLYLSYLYFCNAQCCQRKTKMYKNTLYRQMGNTGEIYESLRILEYVREIKKQNDLFYTHMVKYSKLINISLLESASKRSCSQFFFNNEMQYLASFRTVPVYGQIPDSLKKNLHILQLFRFIRNTMFYQTLQIPNTYFPGFRIKTNTRSKKILASVN